MPSVPRTPTPKVGVSTENSDVPSAAAQKFVDDKSHLTVKHFQGPGRAPFSLSQMVLADFHGSLRPQDQNTLVYETEFGFGVHQCPDCIPAGKFL